MKHYLSLIGLSILQLSAASVDLIVFSYNRPMQLYAFLESVEKYVSNVGVIAVIYRVDSDRYDQAYNQVFKKFKNLRLYRQGSEPLSDFKPRVLQAFHDVQSSYIMFAVDDIIMIDYVDCNECVAALEKTKAFGFYLRLGVDITYCYMLNRSQAIPSLEPIGDGMYAWQFAQAECDWAYSYTVDMTIYKKQDIESLVNGLHYKAPNSFEAGCEKQCRNNKRFGLCCEKSKLVNIPLNGVQKEWKGNRQMSYISADDLLQMFEQGFRIDIDKLECIEHNAPHVCYEPVYKRE